MKIANCQKRSSALVAGCLLIFGLAGLQPLFADEIDFNRDIRPLLSENCFFCHGPDDNQREADLRLDLEESAHDYAIVPNDIEASPLVARISSDDEDEKMPPVSSGKSLSKKQVDLIKKWIASGGNYQNHWSFTPASKSKIPVQSEPIKFLVERRLRDKGLTLSERASKEALIRRVTFDLTGLPPTLNEIDSFLDDNTENAFEKVVDQLLESSHYGERMTSDWLDVARYSDTYGYQVDRDRRVWPWRDWVIRSFNDNLPYDQFIAEQIAGDLIPNATEDQKLATTFCRLHPQKVEGGSDPEEFRIEYVADRTQTFATGIMGLTVECCRCHHHKFDPISQQEYYQLTAFFDNIDEAGLYSFFTDSVPTPTLKLPTETQQQTLKELKASVNKSETHLQQLESDELNRTFPDWLKSDADEQLQSQIDGQITHLDFESGIVEPNESVEGKAGSAVRLTGDDPVKLDGGNFDRSDPFSVSLWMNPPDHSKRAVIFHRSRAWTDAGSRGFQLLLRNGHLSFSLVHFMPGNAITVRSKHKIQIGRWTHVTVTYNGSSQASGIKLFVDGRRSEVKVIRDQLTKNIRGGGADHISIGERFRDRGFKLGLVDEFRVFDRELVELEVKTLFDPQLKDKAPQEFDHELREKQLRDFYIVNHELYKAELKILQSKRRELFKVADSVDEIMVMQELADSNPTFRLERGVYDSPAEEVQPNTPQALPGFPDDQPRNRLGLARWATSTEHPLTSRVAVNRIWQMCFGEGLVRTPEDFGSQGEPPTHPELLDWLARDLVENGWNIKRLIKQIVTSEVYQQSSLPRLNHAGEIIDPENRWLARGPNYRLPAEMLRDSALAISGLLVDKTGGPPAKPYEISESFKPANPDSGEGLYRRSLYTYWKRTGPAPAMLTLDAAKRDVCRMKRERTATPLASLVLMNGPQYVEANRALAARVLERHNSKVDQVLVDMFRVTTGRVPGATERTIIKKLYETQLDYFSDNVSQREEFLAIGNFKASKELDKDVLAAAAVVAGMIFNLDESITKR